MDSLIKGEVITYWSLDEPLPILMLILLISIPTVSFILSVVNIIQAIITNGKIAASADPMLTKKKRTKHIIWGIILLVFTFVSAFIIVAVATLLFMNAVVTSM